MLTSDQASSPPTSAPSAVNGFRGACEYTDANDQAGLEVDGDIQPLYGSGWVAFLQAGQQTLTLGSGVVGCRDDYAVFQENVQAGHIYLLTGWGDPTAYTEETAWVDITTELTGDGGVILVNLSSVTAVDFDLGAGEPITVTSTNYVVVPGAAPSTIAATPAAEPATVPGHSSPGHYWLVVYRDNTDGTGAELASPAAVAAP